MAAQPIQATGTGEHKEAKPTTGAQSENPLNRSMTPHESDYAENPFAVPPANDTDPLAAQTAPQPTDGAMNVALPPSPEAAPTADATPAAAASTSTTPTAETTTPAEAPVSPPSAPTATSSEATLENFHKEMKWERHGYRPTAYFKTVEDARASHHDLNRTEAYVSVKHGGFTAEELAAIPDNAKQKNYYIGFAKQMLDSNEGIFTKKFWTSFEGIKKVLTAGIIKGEVEEVRLEAAEWLVSKRGAGTPATPVSPEESAAKEASPTPSTSTPPVTPTPEASAATEAESAGPVTEPLRLQGPTTETPVVEAEVIETPHTPKHEETPRGAAAPIIDVEVIEAPVTQEATPATHTSPSPGEATTPSVAADKKERSVETKTLDTAALQEIERRVQEKLEALRGRIIPETITVRLDDPKSAQAVRQMQRYGEGLNAGFAAQASKVQEALQAVGNLGLDQPQQAIVFKRRQEEALALVDSLSFGHDELNKMANDIKVPRGNKLPDSMKEAMANSSDILEGIKNDLDEARRLIANARRINPATKAEQDGASPSGTEPKVEVKTGSVASMPRLGKDLTIDPRKLELMGHAMVDANISDKDLNAWYKMVMSEFVKSYVGTFSKVRKEIYEARMDGSNMTEMQKEKFKFLADELGTEVKVSDLVQLDYSKFSLPYTEELDTRFRRVIDGSKFQKALNQMKAEFATALTKEIEKVPGTENTDTTYVAFKRQTFEKSGVTDYFAKN